MLKIMDYIAKGRENAIKRDELVRLLNLPDRIVRKMIQEARDRGEIILNAQDGAGYYTSDDLGELERQYNTNQRRALSILRQQKYLRSRMREAAAREGGQVIFPWESFVFRVDDEVIGRG